MKKLIVFAFLMALQTGFAQNITKNLGDFSTVKVYDRISVKLVSASENKIVISGSRANDVEIVTKGNDLKVKMKLTKLLTGEDVTAILYYKSINDVEANEGAYISSEDTFKAPAFTLNAKEGAKIKLNLDAQNVKTKLHTGGEVELTGKAVNHDVTITSGGILKARSFATAQTDISVNAGGEADINASDAVIAKVRAGGNIDIYGNPKQVDKKITAGGNIEVRK
jgi:hypothetical protein